MSEPTFIDYKPPRTTPRESVERSREFHAWLNGRRTVRMFSPEPVPRETIENLILAASTAPSGAHKQPWTFVAISDAEMKKRIRAAAEGQERRFYRELAPEDWLNDLAPLGTDWVKRHITDAPWLIVVFAQDHGLRDDGTRAKHYYVQESVGIAVGFLLVAIWKAGLVALTHTPSPMNFLKRLLGRSDNERAYLLIPVGYAAPDARVPDLRRKGIGEIAVWFE